MFKKNAGRLVSVLLLCMMLLPLISCGAVTVGPDDAMASRNFTITHGMMAYYFFNHTIDLLGSYSDAELADMGLDVSENSAPFKEQKYDNERSWYDYLIEETSAYMKTLLVECEFANAAGIKLEKDDLAYIDEQLNNYRMEAFTQMNAGLDDYLAGQYRGYVNTEDLIGVLKIGVLLSKANNSIIEEVNTRVTDSVVNEMVASTDGEKDMTPTKNISHIMISFENHESKDEAKAIAEEVYSKFISGEKTEAAFTALAEEYNEYGESVFENVRDGDLDPALDVWTSDAARKVGDIGRIDSSYGAHILFYSGNGDAAYLAAAKISAYDKMFTQWISDMQKKYKIAVNDDVLNDIDI